MLQTAARGGFGMRNILITGGAGFVGRRLVRQFLEEGNEVHVVDCIHLATANSRQSSILSEITPGEADRP
jgi:nucleoside-diphosphate-sugar epimerase